VDRRACRGARQTYALPRQQRWPKWPAAIRLAIPDPLLPLAYVAAITKTIKLATGILILPQRHPIYTAKEVATLDVLSGGTRDPWDWKVDG